jgi:hypothetical protein
MTPADRYPLAWPVGRPRKPAKDRARGDFTASNRRITFEAAVARLEDEITRLGGAYPILSSNLELRLDGRPRVDSKPPDPGVCLYFRIKDEPYAMACDTYTEVAQNVAAIAEHVKATRLIARYGVATAAEALQAFRALPPPGGGVPTARPWRAVLGFAASFPSVDLTRDEVLPLIDRRYRNKAAELAADQDALSELNVARDQARRELSA